MWVCVLSSCVCVRACVCECVPLLAARNALPVFSNWVHRLALLSPDYGSVLFTPRRDTVAEFWLCKWLIFSFIWPCCCLPCPPCSLTDCRNRTEVCLQKVEIILKNDFASCVDCISYMIAHRKLYRLFGRVGCDSELFHWNYYVCPALNNRYITRF